MNRAKKQMRAVAAFPLFATLRDPVPERRTYVILGVPRGGTTSVAGTARLSGLWIGEDLPTNLEDPAFNLDLHNRGGRDAVAEIKAALATRNDDRPVWGWKYPRASSYLDAIRDDLVNPRLIVVTRDIVATASWGVGRREPQEQLEAVKLRVQQTTRNIDLVDRWKVPTLMVSYERAVAGPENFVPALSRFLGFRPPQDLAAITEFLRPGSYKPVPDQVDATG